MDRRDRIRKYEEPPPPQFRRRDTPYFIAALGLLVIAVFLEDAMTGANGVRVEDIHEHTAVPIGGHGLAAAAIVVALFPSARDAWAAARQKRLHWKTAVLVIVAGLFIAGQALIAAALAVVLSLAIGEFSWRRSRR